ncbi:MAG TPA: nucleotide exchange factor GrpE, partial [Pyrinomonadaceae bacterium]|nr:nucleotide exchange factor GrpE [Pyrinomonadaceae bacterium]
MAPEGKDKSNIPINFVDSDADETGDTSHDQVASESDDDQQLINAMDPEDDSTPEVEVLDFDEAPEQSGAPPKGSTGELALKLGGPEVAELVATRAELKRLESEVKDLRDSLARRQADFENYRKRMERERSDTFNRVVVDIAAKLLPVLDNLKRALETEASVEASESDEFRHFLSGVDLIY